MGSKQHKDGRMRGCQVRKECCGGVCGGVSLPPCRAHLWKPGHKTASVPRAKSDVFPSVPQPDSHHTNAWSALDRAPQQRRSSAVLLLLLLVTYSALLVMPRASPTVWRCGRWHIRAVKMCHSQILIFYPLKVFESLARQDH